MLLISKLCINNTMFLIPIDIYWHICIRCQWKTQINMHIKQINMHIKHKYFSPFLSIINKGVQTKKFLFLVVKQQKSNSKDSYMRYSFMKRKDVKLTPHAYMHYMKKRWLDPNYITQNIQCIKGDVKLLLHRCKTHREERSSSLIWDTLNMNIYI